ncbi:MAG TPA: RES family NAD+ phosphorylase [Telluria sp.]
MAALLPPGPDFPRLPLEIELIDPALLYRVSRHASGEPYFGRSRGNRFDDPTWKRADRFGTCYLGLDLTVAMAESLLHDVEPNAGRFDVALSEIEARYVFRFHGPALRLANLTGTALFLLGGNGELSGTTDYKLTQRWSRAVCAHPDKVDGFLYMSRRVNDSLAVVLFERDKSAPLPLSAAAPVRLGAHRDFVNSATTLRLCAV